MAELCCDEFLGLLTPEPSLCDPPRLDASPATSSDLDESFYSFASSAGCADSEDDLLSLVETDRLRLAPSPNALEVFAQPHAEVPQPPATPASARRQPPPLKLKLTLDCGAVASAWRELGGGRLVLDACPSLMATLEESLLSMLDSTPDAPGMPSAAAASGGTSHVHSAGSLADVGLEGRRAALARFKDKKSTRSAHPIKKVRYEARRVNAAKRPRIKGRFVKKEDLAAYLAQQAEQEALMC